MAIQYINPLSRAFERMKIILFRPFDLGKWFALGFTAFLASLMNSPGGAGGGGNYNIKDKDFEWDAFFRLPSGIMEWISAHPLWAALIIAGIFIALVIVVLLIWLSSRGMFMFLDNVVHNRSLIEKPWREFKTRGDSLFLWRLAFMIITFLVFSGTTITAFLLAYKNYLEGVNLFSNLLSILWIAFIGFLLLFVAFYIWLFLDNFVVPIMYKTGFTANKSWLKFLELLEKHPMHFILYGLYIICLYIVVVICVVVAGLLTCCCGFILISIPYIGSVLMLPVSVTFRALSLEYLEQFGDEYRIFPVAADDAGVSADENVNPIV
ncbi:MAG: hypothetical protein JW944_10515 [Deltaproteobacteria bacterium]|nr:hypothetical protein [Deltaproteobacteria bacterium]